MLSLFRTIRFKLFFSFFILLFITAGFLVLSNFWFDKREQGLQKVLDKLNSVNVNIQKAEKEEAIFFKDEVINESFHGEGTSEVLSRRKMLIKNIRKDFQFLKSALATRSLETEGEIKKLERNLDAYEQVFDTLVDKIMYRGFKDFGIEGKMRQYIHAIENAPDAYDRAKMLMIRRHEKDFILRKQGKYIQDHSDAIETLRAEIQNKPKLTNDLIAYQKYFNLLVKAEQEIGFTNTEGLKGELADLGIQNNERIQELNNQIEAAVASIRTQNQITQTGLFTAGAILVFILVFFVTRSLSQPIMALSRSIHEVIEHRFSQDVEFKRIDSRDELGLLSQDMGYMIETVQNNISQIQEQKAVVEKKQRILMEGVSYAQRIQQAILPDYEINQYFKKYFILYRPRYDVSGDFYWFTELNGKFYLAVVDCTGHGVSGAFMSMIGNTLLNEVIDEKKIQELPFILETLNTEFKMALHQNQRLSDDSLDICLVCLEPHPEKENYWKVQYSGANRSLFYSQGWDIVEIKPTPRSIGGRHIDKNKTFEEHEVALKKGNFLYLTTDGFMNQNNSQQKKYGTTRFKEFLGKTIHLPVKQQEEQLNRELDTFMKGCTQRDDITVFVLKL